MRTGSAAMVLAAGLTLVGCSSPSDGAEPVPAPSSVPSIQPTAADLVAAVGPFEARYSFQGPTAASNAVAIAVPAGMAFATTLKNGTAVSAGQRIGSLSIPAQDRKGLTAAAVGGTAAASRFAAMAAREEVVKAPLAGTLLIAGGPPRIAAAGLDATAVLNPLQELRLQGMPFAGTLAVEDLFGYRTANCIATWVEPTADGHLLRCRIPSDVQTAAGLPARIAMKSAPQNVIAVPARFVGFDSARGGSYFVQRRGPSGQPSRVPVVVGPTDGVRRVLVSGVQAGDRLVAVNPAGS